MTILSAVTRVDYVGEYVEYLHSDGHRDTSPPNRPATKEDVQRERRRQVFAEDANGGIAAQNQRLAVTPMEGRDLAAQIGSAAVLDTFRQTAKAVQQMAGTNTTPPALLSVLASTVDLGGDIVSDAPPPRIGKVSAPVQSTLRPPIMDLGIR